MSEGLIGCAGQITQQIAAHFWRSLTAILHKESQQAAHSGKVGTIADDAALSF